MYPVSTRIRQHLLRPFLRNKCSTPFLSQAFFRNLCDFEYVQTSKIKSDQMAAVRNADIIYCNSFLLEDFLEDFEGELFNKTIVSGSSDKDFYVTNQLFYSVKKLFLQNSFISDNERIFTLPIGLEDLSFALNGFPSLLKSHSKKTSILVGPFSHTHPIRSEILNGIQSGSDIHVVREMLSPRRYSKIAGSYAGIACPRGNGVDTHRFWETLYRNSVPIVQRSQWSQSIKSYGIPLVEVESWAQIEFNDAVVSVRSRELQATKIAALWDDYWRRCIRNS